MIPIDLSKQQVLNAEPKAIKQSNLIGNLDRSGNITMSSIMEKAK